MDSPQVTLSASDRSLVDKCIRRTCEIRGWSIHALSVRTNHVHLVVTANMAPELVMGQLKSWATRWLAEMHGKRPRWWTRHGSTRWINDSDSLGKAVDYVKNQDKPPES
ncbi:MAG: transposase [Phycisphaerae bacterium]